MPVKNSAFLGSRQAQCREGNAAIEKLCTLPTTRTRSDAEVPSQATQGGAESNGALHSENRDTDGSRGFFSHNYCLRRVRLGTLVTMAPELPQRLASYSTQGGLNLCEDNLSASCAGIPEEQLIR